MSFHDAKIARPVIWHVNSRKFDVTPWCQDRSSGHYRQAEEHERGGHLLVPEEVPRNDDEVRQALKHGNLRKKSNGVYT